MAGKNKKSSYGPGFLVTAAFIGPGTVTTCSLAGAQFGYTLIFALVFATVTTIILQGMTGRLSLGSNHDLAQSLREFPQSRTTRAVFIVLTLSSITFGCAAYEAGNIIGGTLGLETVTSIPHKYWVALISLLAVLILGLGKYKLVEKLLIFLVFLMSVSFLTTLIIIKPNLLSLLKGMVPSFPNNSLYLILALVGTTVVPYNLFLHSAAVKEKWNTVTDLKKVKKDLLLSITLGGIISISIVMTSAVAFYEKGLTPEDGIQLAQQLKPLFGTFTNFLFGLGFFAAGMSSALTAPYAAAFASSGVLGWKGGPDSKKFKGVWLGVIIVGFIVSSLNLKPLTVIVFAQAANGIVLPVASIFLLIVLNNRQRMRELANNIQQNILGTLIVLIVTCLGLWNIVKLFLK
ncbi:MAG: Nramp family divalent metal transporter [Candidatus Aminicenantes bacterium]|jgi:NRAMP (natural resistance-associated macrophage protein)-like metal ion transporter